MLTPRKRGLCQYTSQSMFSSEAKSLPSSRGQQQTKQNDFQVNWRMMCERVAIAARLVALVLCCSRTAAAQSVAESPETPVTESILLTPPQVDGPVVVHAAFHLLNISGIDDETETVGFSGVLTLVWKDARQAFDPDKEGVSEKSYNGVFQFNELSPAWYPQVTLANASGEYESRAVLLRVSPDGTSTLTEAVDAVAKVNLQLRRYPFDRQRLEAVFDVLGFDASEVMLDTTPVSASAPDGTISVPQWTLKGVEAAIFTREVPDNGATHTRSAFVVTLDMRRNSLFTLRLVVLPLMLIVMLSWSVFWMDRSSLGDRMSISFVGILTAVAYQITLGDILPHVSYVTFVHGFLNVSMLLMAATVVINLVVGAADKRGDVQRGDQIDQRCRWIFPLAYFGLNLIILGAVFLFF